MNTYKNYDRRTRKLPHRNAAELKKRLLQVLRLQRAPISRRPSPAGGPMTASLRSLSRWCFDAIVTAAGPVRSTASRRSSRPRTAAAVIVSSPRPGVRIVGPKQPIVDTLTKDPASAKPSCSLSTSIPTSRRSATSNVTMQSTLIAFKGKTERKRSTPSPNPEQIRTLFQSGASDPMGVGACALGFAAAS